MEPDEQVSSARPRLQSTQAILIRAPLSKVWEFNQDLRRISDYHPRVSRVEFVSGKERREAGAAYVCHLKDGKNSCVERDLEVVPMERILTALPEDTMGLARLFPDYVVETTFTPQGAAVTRMEFKHYYSTPSAWAWLVNLFARRRIAREAVETLDAIKRTIEAEHDGPAPAEA